MPRPTVQIIKLKTLHAITNPVFLRRKPVSWLLEAVYLLWTMMMAMWGQNECGCKIMTFLDWQCLAPLATLLPILLVGKRTTEYLR